MDERAYHTRCCVSKAFPRDRSVKTRTQGPGRPACPARDRAGRAGGRAGAPDRRSAHHLEHPVDAAFELEILAWSLVACHHAHALLADRLVAHEETVRLGAQASF